MKNKPYSVLIVDDSKLNLAVLADVLEDCGYEVGFAMNGKEAIDYVSIESPDLILLDVMMPEMDGYECCKILKSNPKHKDIPVIFLTAKVETEDIVKGFEVGGSDYISKPFNNHELKSRVKAHILLKRAQDENLKMIEELNKANAEIEEKNAELKEMIKQLDKLSKTDSLTGLYNRRFMLDRIEFEADRSEDNKISFTIVMGDIDCFKKINDTYGHDFGDFVLREVSNIVKGSIRKNDICARWGGEEYLIMLKDTSLEQGRVLTERLRQTINNHKFIFNGNEATFTMTFGLSEYCHPESIDEVIKKADNALYKGKNSGKNVVFTCE